MTSSDLERTRSLYRLLVHEHNDGLTRDEIRLKLNTNDRAARDARSRCAVLAAQHPHPQLGRRIIGFDPALGRYVDAKDAQQAERVMLYQHSRARELLLALSEQTTAYLERFGPPPESIQAVQDALFNMEQVEQRMRWTR